MKWRSYLIFGLLSLVVSALSVVLWMINPFTDLLLLLAAPPLRLLGYHPPVQGWSGLGSAMLISFLWPSLCRSGAGAGGAKFSDTPL